MASPSVASVSALQLYSYAPCWSYLNRRLNRCQNLHRSCDLHCRRWQRIRLCRPIWGHTLCRHRSRWRQHYLRNSHPARSKRLCSPGVHCRWVWPIGRDRHCTHRQIHRRQGRHFHWHWERPWHPHRPRRRRRRRGWQHCLQGGRCQRAHCCRPGHRGCRWSHPWGRSCVSVSIGNCTARLGLRK